MVVKWQIMARKQHRKLTTKYRETRLCVLYKLPTYATGAITTNTSISLCFTTRCVCYNESSHYCPDVRLSVRPSTMGVQCDYTVHASADLRLWLDSPMFWPL